MKQIVFLCIGLMAGLAGCTPGEKPAQPPVQVLGDTPPCCQDSASNPEGEKPMSIKVTSTAFAEGAKIPKKYTGEGEDVSPPLAWSGVPEGTKELALICDDPDAPTAEPWVHWVIYHISASATGLPEGVPSTPRLENPAGALQGKNSWPSGQAIGYRGPMPPPGHGPHRYFFRLYALNAPVAAEPGDTKKLLLEQMSGHVLGEGQLMGTYERK